MLGAGGIGSRWMRKVWQRHAAHREAERRVVLRHRSPDPLDFDSRTTIDLFPYPLPASLPARIPSRTTWPHRRAAEHSRQLR
jgi:hypothetical protein